ncbi:hypothetical protein MVEN_02445300 [Mycena venus]|uniref:Uncharacterized protein n=1 Tax=Mycena venus TaxID=2733690 RepID=A0A8H6WYJ1_9AGAR|nr:hypothetical protein MVEN_02445300 [Mycena venus]
MERLRVRSRMASPGIQDQTGISCSAVSNNPWRPIHRSTATFVDLKARMRVGRSRTVAPAFQTPTEYAERGRHCRAFVSRLHLALLCFSKMKPGTSQDSSSSANFIKLYESLPPEAKQKLVEKKLAPLLDLVPKERAKKVIKSVNLLQSKYGSIPTLDLKGKKRELHGLLDELSRDSKRAIVRERSNREELLTEIVESMLNWLNDIWTVVYEYNVHFDKAHACLLFVAEVLNTLNSIPGMGGQCRCTIAHLSINVPIRRSGKIIKQFNFTGFRDIDRALLWIWRDLFVSMLAKRIRTEKIPGMLSDIEESLGWQALERLLYGGFKTKLPILDDDDDEDEGDSFLDECLEDETTDDEEGAWSCPCRLHATHWSGTINTQRTKLRDLIYQHLLGLFELTPSHKLYTSILAVSLDAAEIEAELLDSLDLIAGSSADTLVAALEIHGSEGNYTKLVNLLDDHSYLLRPRDAHVLQNAASVLSEFGPFHARALQIAEKEILDSAAAIRVAVRTSFCRVEDKARADALAEITKLRSDNPSRTPRIEAWVDSVTTPGSPASHPMAFAAMILGFPFAAGIEDSDEMDMLGYIDADPRDPDFDDLREEFRPKLRDRFDGWVSTAAAMKGGHLLLGKLYFKIVEQMPYFKVNDVAEEMLGRLGDRPSKVHVADGFEAVLSFCKVQRKKMSVRAEKRRKNEAAKKAAAAMDSSFAPPPAPPTPTPAPPAPTPAPPPPNPQNVVYPYWSLPAAGPSTGSSSSPFPSGLGSGGMEDVD